MRDGAHGVVVLAGGGGGAYPGGVVVAGVEAPVAALEWCVSSLIFWGGVGKLDETHII